MKSKKLAITLSFFAGSAGAHRFYLGQRSAGFITLLVFWVLLPGLIWYVIHFNVFPNWEPFLLARFALPVLYQLFETGRFLVMSDEKFKSQDKSRSKTFLPTILSILLTAALITGGNKMLAGEKHIDITKADATAILSAREMSGEFRADEDTYRKKYDNNVLQVQGIIAETGNDFEQGAYFALQGLNNDPFGIKCYFEKENGADAEMVKIGDSVVVKGVANGNKLENSKLLQLNDKKIPLTNK